jgi:hypothetical protein
MQNNVRVDDTCCFFCVPAQKLGALNAVKCPLFSIFVMLSPVLQPNHEVFKFSN